MKLTIRVKLFLAFALLAAVGASGGVLSLLNLEALARTYQTEQRHVATHEALHDDRVALLSLPNLAAVYDRGRDTEVLHLIEQRLRQLDSSTQACIGCHTDSPTHVEFARRLKELRELLLAAPGEALAGPPLRAPSAQGALETLVGALDASLGRMEERYHQVLGEHREASETILEPSLWQQLALVAGGLVVALLLAWLMSRALSRPILPLIAAARRIGAGGVGRAANRTGDPDLAQVEVALSELTTLVARRAHEDAQRSLLDRVISSQEDERKRLARELHDELGQSLSALLMKIRSPPTRGAGTAVDVMDLETRVSRLLDEVRRMAWDLRPSLLDDLGIHLALSRLAEEVHERYSLAIDFQAVGFDQGHDRLPGRTETVLYRVAQEALNNVARHAHARHVSVVLVRQGQEVALVVEDDGAGFDVGAVRRGRSSLGVLGMEERLALVGGSFVLESTPGQGTTVQARIPLGGVPS